ncbi:hypothetical protein N7457_003649 [Penicillium paradoxum]|uniref:uncharacterized protein n=1 Tax=Penicillium paradoxum TaxID=176176 RepID=UPI00254675E5|nr:uncharacterized protein N7457_003649 [Penicillium paradoxum]KAJ5788659.1 hypothetical protein N7457_003649 [Penicillium paradoxum]
MLGIILSPHYIWRVIASSNQCFQSRPDICVPVLNVTHYEHGYVTPGYIFIAPYEVATFDDGPYIYSHTGELAWAGAVGNEFVHNLHPCHIEGHEKICMLSMQHGVGVQASGPVVALDPGLYTRGGERDFTEILGGKEPDLHELNVVDNGTAVLTTWLMNRPWDLSPVGGPVNGYLRSSGFQEIDIQTQTVNFMWDAADHIEIEESHMELTHRRWGNGISPETDWDFFHINSVDKTKNGDYLISARHTSTIYMISGQNGTVLWRLGGKRPDFTFEAGLNFSSQHHARVQEEESNSIEISLFDNGFDEWHQTALSSSGLVLRVDMQTMHVSLVHRYLSPRRILTNKTGSVQSLKNGNVFIYWGGTPFLSEHTLDGSRVVFEARLADPTGYWYRGWKANFTTTPTTSPDVYAVSDHISGPTTWFVSWNGATEVRGWRVYASQEELGGYKFIGYFEKTGFETKIEREDFFAWSIIEAVNGIGLSLCNSSAPIRTFRQDLARDDEQSVLRELY